MSFEKKFRDGLFEVESVSRKRRLLDLTTGKRKCLHEAIKLPRCAVVRGFANQEA